MFFQKPLNQIKILAIKSQKHCKGKLIRHFNIMRQKPIFVQKEFLAPQRIVLIGGPGTGKTTLINALAENGLPVFEEVSRQITREAQEQGVEQLFLTQPLLFSEKLLEGRISQFNSSGKTDSPVVFLDRGIPDVLAYMDFVGQSYPDIFKKACEDYRYDQVFELPPWREIHTTDGERYEDFEKAVEIHKAIRGMYIKYNYNPHIIPHAPVEERVEFLLNAIRS